MGRKEIQHKVGAVLEMVQLAALAGRMPKELSGGQQQRVAFARAVVSEPPVLLMDEPLGALDLKLRQAMQLEIKRYHAALGCTIIFVTHDQEEALVLSDRVAVMGDGKIRQVDTPSGIYDRPNSRYVAEFIGKTNILRLDVRSDGSSRIVETGTQIGHGATQERENRLLSVRPEKIVRARAGRAGCVTFSGTVDEVLFLGNAVQYGVRVSDGSLLLVQEHRSAQLGELKVREDVELQFLLEDALRVAP